MVGVGLDLVVVESVFQSKQIALRRAKFSLRGLGALVLLPRPNGVLMYLFATLAYARALPRICIPGNSISFPHHYNGLDQGRVV